MSKIKIQLKKKFYESGFCTMYYTVVTEKYKKFNICAIDVMREEQEIEQSQFHTHTGGDYMEPDSPVWLEKFELEIIK